MPWVGKWEGGRVLQTKRGARRWVLERTVEGRRYVITLEVTTLDRALIELRLFSVDPVAYLRSAKAPAPTWEAAAGFARALKEHTPEYAKATLAKVAWWKKKLRGRPLEQATVDDLNRHLATLRVGTKPYIVSLKSFTHYLRRSGLLSVADDPSMALQVPPTRPGKAPGERAYPAEVIERAYRQLTSQHARDTFRVLAVTGLHRTEVERLASGNGTVEVVNDPSGIYAVARYIHKNGTPHSTSLDQVTHAALIRLVRRGSAIARAWLAQASAPVKPGRLRHSFTTAALQHGEVVRPVGTRGVSREEISEALGHSASTNRRFYSDVSVPPMIRIPLTLRHPRDPTPLLAQGKRRSASP